MIENPVNPALQLQPTAVDPAAARDEKLKEVNANRILDEWKANVQLYIHHDNLKQERIRHFLNMQAALLAFVGLSTKQAIEGWGTPLTAMTFLSLSIGISIIATQLAYSWKAMDERARKFTLFERKKLREAGRRMERDFWQRAVYLYASRRGAGEQLRRGQVSKHLSRAPRQNQI